MATATKSRAKLTTKNRLSDESNGKGSVQSQTKSSGPAKERISVPAPALHKVEFTIRGTAPYIQNKFSQKARQQIKETQEAGSTARKGKKRSPKDFQQMYENAKHVSTEGWVGMPASAFRNAMVSACRLVGFKMTIAKLSIWADCDGFDADDQTPLIKITKGKPQYSEHPVRLQSGGADIHARPMWLPGWEAKVRFTFDSDVFTPTDVAHLLIRVGAQVGIGEGRNDSKASCGMGMGSFEVASEGKIIK